MSSIQKSRWRLHRLIIKLGDKWLALIEQGTQSATNFLTMILISSFCGLEALGYYAVGRYVMLLLGGMQNSLVSFPYTILFRQQRAEGSVELGSDRPRSVGAGLGYARRHLVISSWFGGLALVLFLASGLATSVAQTSYTGLCLALSFATPMYLMREFSRRHEFAHLRIPPATYLSVICATLQLGGLVWLRYCELLSVEMAFVVVGLSCFVTNAVWLICRAAEFGRTISRSRTSTSSLRASEPTAEQGGELAGILVSNWKIGKWIFSTQTIMDILMLAVQSTLVFFVDETAGGIFAACFAVVSLCNPVVRGLSNLLTPVFAKLHAEATSDQLVGSVKKSTLGFAGLLLVLGAAVVLFGDHLIGFFYDKPIEQLTHILFVLSLSMLVQAAGLPAFHALNTIGQPRKAFAPRVVGVIVGALVLALWGVSLKELGASYSLLIANLLITGLTGLRFWNSINQNRYSASSSLVSI